jgi:WD40 repeat protein
VYDLATRQRVARLVCPHEIQGLMWSPDGKYVVSRGEYNRELRSPVRVWDTTSWKLRSFDGHTSDVRRVAFAPNSKTLASGGEDATVRLWDVETGKPAGLKQGHQKGLSALDWSPDGKLVASGGLDQLVFLWPAEGDGKPVALGEQGHPVEKVHWSPDGTRLAVLAGGTVHVWSADGKRLHTWHLDAYRDGTLHWLPDSKTLLSTRPSGMSVALDATTGKRLATLLHLRNGHGIALSPQGHFRGETEIGRSLAYVVETEKGQETLSESDFRERYGWHNDPSRVTITAP